MEKLLTCQVCGASSDSARVVHRRRDDVLVECPNCHTVYANPQYTLAELEPLYTTEYYDEQKNLHTDFREQDYANHATLNRTVLRDLFSRYPELAPSTHHTPRVLDYGCGVGYFLLDCKRAGFDPIGLEFSSVAATYARERFELDVRTDPDNSLRHLPDDTFDLVTAWQVLEHVRRPRELLTEFHRILRPGGVLCVAVPHLDALGYRWKKEHWFNIQNLTHLTFFTRESLTGALTRVGFREISRPLFWGGRADFGWLMNLVQYGLRWLGWNSELRLYAVKASSR